MFQRQSRQAFPIRNILVLIAIVLGFLYLVISQRQKAAQAPAAPATEQPG
ncbi:MAG: hypothetical protein IT260_18730 [Saprospiraceae bacterium]|nr:hypothetical protein [Saprospiraceae bacterium]